MANVVFKDYSVQIKKWLNDTAIAFLEEAKSSMASQASKLSPVDTGNLRQSFQTDSIVVPDEKTAYVGSKLEYAIYQEFGTGEYALKGNGRKGGWVYKSKKDGKYYYTKGSTPKRMLYHAFETKKEPIKKRAREMFKG